MVATAHEAIARYLADLSAQGASKSTVAQRSWALRSLLDAAQAGSDAPVDAADLVLRGYELEERIAVEGTSLPTRRARRAAVKALAAFLGVPVQRPDLPTPALRPVLDADAVRAMDRLRTARLPGLLQAECVRTALVLSLVRTAPLSLEQLCELRTGDVDDAMRTLTVRGDGPVQGAVALPTAVRTALAAWYGERYRLVARLQGFTDVVLVSVRPNHDPRTGAVRPAGLPLRPRGLQRSFARCVEAANEVFGTEPGFPLPTSLTWVRRSVPR